MNATNATGGMSGGDNFGGFGYGIGVAIGVLLLVTTITLASYYCTRSTLTPPQRPHRQQQPPLDAFEAAYDQPAGAAADVEAGLDEATLLSYPKFLYSQAKLRKKDTTASCCSICLADYKDSDMLRLLPDCGHLFHIKCVDEWLRLHPTCPVCRTSPLPTPLSTPLAEVVPLATRRS